MPEAHLQEFTNHVESLYRRSISVKIAQFHFQGKFPDSTLKGTLIPSQGHNTSLQVTYIQNSNKNEMKIRLPH